MIRVAWSVIWFHIIRIQWNEMYVRQCKNQYRNRIPEKFINMISMHDPICRVDYYRCRRVVIRVQKSLYVSSTSTSVEPLPRSSVCYRIKCAPFQFVPFFPLSLSFSLSIFTVFSHLNGFVFIFVFCGLNCTWNGNETFIMNSFVFSFTFYFLFVRSKSLH